MYRCLLDSYLNSLPRYLPISRPQLSMDVTKVSSM